MNTPPIVTPEEWQGARRQLFVKEKELVRSGTPGRRPPADALAGG